VNFDHDDLRRSALIMFAAIALLTIPTFVSGVGACGLASVT